jgi:hypothetical protein
VTGNSRLAVGHVTHIRRERQTHPSVSMSIRIAPRVQCHLRIRSCHSRGTTEEKAACPYPDLRIKDRARSFNRHLDSLLRGMLPQTLVGLCSFFEIRFLTCHLFKKLVADSTQATQLTFASQSIKSYAKALYLKPS